MSNVVKHEPTFLVSSLPLMNPGSCVYYFRRNLGLNIKVKLSLLLIN
jgi:hypothetical protein